MQLGAAKKGQGRPGARAAACGLRRRRRPVRRAARLLSNRSAPAAGSFDEGAPHRWRVCLALRWRSQVMGGKGAPRLAGPGEARRGLCGDLCWSWLFGPCDAPTPALRRIRVHKKYIQRTFRKPSKNQANEKESTRVVEVRARRRRTSAPSPAGARPRPAASGVRPVARRPRGGQREWLRPHLEWRPGARAVA